METFLWVKGASALASKKSSDELARKGNKSIFIGPEPVVDVTSGAEINQLCICGIFSLFVFIQGPPTGELLTSTLTSW